MKKTTEVRGGVAYSAKERAAIKALRRGGMPAVKLLRNIEEHLDLQSKNNRLEVKRAIRKIIDRGGRPWVRLFIHMANVRPRPKGETADALRELIGVSLQEQRLLEASAAKFPELSLSISRSIGFRRKVAEEFKRLLVRGTSHGAIAQSDAPQDQIES